MNEKTKDRIKCLGYWGLPFITVSLLAALAYSVLSHLTERQPVTATIITTYSIGGGILGGSAHTVVELDDGRRFTVAGVRGLAGDRVTVELRSNLLEKATP